MKNKFEQPGEKYPVEETPEIQPQLQEVETMEVPVEEKVDAALERQDGELNQREAKHDRKTLTGFRKLVALSMVIGSSLLAVGCNAEKPSNGFTDNPHTNVEQRVKQAHEQFKHMKEMKNYKPGKEAKKSAKEMNEGSIVQPINPDMRTK